jgi:hypothetical protein
LVKDDLFVDLFKEDLLSKDKVLSKDDKLFEDKGLSKEDLLSEDKGLSKEDLLSEDDKFPKDWTEKSVISGNDTTKSEK